MNNKTSISRRGESVPASPIRKLVPLAEKAKAKGTKVYHLNIGQPDFEIPVEIKDELKELSSSLKILPYANSSGEKELLDAWVKYYKSVGIEIEKDHVLVTSGGSEAIILAAASIFDPGDEFIVFEPFYANYLGFGELLSVGIIPVSLDTRNNYRLPSKEEIISKITPQTKAVFFTNPNNPSGTVFTKNELRTVLNIAKEHGLFIVADETYRGICFDGKKSLSFLQIATEEEKDLIIVVDSVSKRLNICGARIGCIVSTNKVLMEAVGCFGQARLAVATLEQKMIAPFLGNCLDYIESLAVKYEARRNTFLNELQKGLGQDIHYPEGAFYTMIKLPFDNGEDFSKWLLTDFQDNGETVMVAPGSGFYCTEGKGRDEIRVAFVLNEKDLKRAAQLLSKAVIAFEKLQNK